MSPRLKSLFLLAALAGGSWIGLRALASAPPPLAASKPAPVPVVTARVQQSDVPIVLNGLGTVRAFNTATIRSQVIGILQKIDFTEGQAVRRGDVLAQIDPRTFQARLEQAQAQLVRDQAQLANVQVNLNRSLPLLSRGFATDQMVTGQRAQVAQLQATVKFDQGAIDDARTQLSFATLTAPFNGVTGVRLLDVGNVIHPTDVNGLVMVTQLQPISVDFTLPSADIVAVQDALANGTVTAAAYDRTGARKLDTGTLLLINNQADPTSGTVQLKATFPNKQKLLWPGTFVDVELITSVAKNALTIPTDAVQRNDRGTFVFVVGSNGKVAQRPVEIGQQLRGQGLVINGLKAGETVVVQGQYRLTPGTIVRAAQPSQVADSSTASAGMLP